MSLPICVFNNFCGILRIDCIQDIEEVISARSFLVWVFVLEVDIELLVLLQVRPESFGTYLLIARYMNIVDLILFHQLLFASQDLPHKVFIYLFFWS